MNLVNVLPSHTQRLYEIVTVADTVPQSFCRGIVPSLDDFRRLLWRDVTANWVLTDPEAPSEVLAYVRLAGGLARDRFAEAFVVVPARHRGQGLGSWALEHARVLAGERLALRWIVGMVPSPFTQCFDSLLARDEWYRAGCLREHLWLGGGWVDVHVIAGRTDVSGGES